MVNFRFLRRITLTAGTFENKDTKRFKDLDKLNFDKFVYGDKVFQLPLKILLAHKVT